MSLSMPYFVTQLISSIALGISVLWTLYIWFTGFVVATYSLDVLYTRPWEYLGIIVVYNFSWLAGVVFIYMVAWLITGKNLFPFRG